MNEIDQSKESLPKISVIMSCFNEQETIARAIESILAQTFTNFEFIIVDDCSIDDTYNICTKYAKKDKRIRLYQLPVNSGTCAAPLNFAIEKSTSSIIARMDGDDVSHPTRFEKQFSFLSENLDIDILGTSVRLVSKADNEVIGTHIMTEKHEDIVKNRYSKSLFYHPSVMIRKKVYDQLGNYDESAYRVEDLNLWLQAFPYFRFHNLQEVLFDFYKRPQQLNNRNKKAFQAGNEVRLRAMKKNNDYIKGIPVLLKRYISFYIKK